MKVEIIQMTWLPGVPEVTATWEGAGWASETIECSGTLLKNGIVVAILPLIRVTPMQNYIDGVFIAPIRYTTMWEMEPVDADTLELHASTTPGSSGYTHAIYVNSKKVGLIFDAGWGVPEDYTYGLKPVGTLMIVGAIVAGTVAIAVLASRAKGK